MRRFHWPLQRPLNVTIQRELALRSELLALLQRITGLRQEAIRRRAALRFVLADLAEDDLERRRARQEVFLNWSPWAEREIRRLRETIRQLTAQRAEKTAQLVRLRKSKETLERLRQEARQEHIREELKQEQKQFDESAQIAFARKAAQSPRSRQAGV